MAFPRETQEMVFAAHDAAFAYWGGVTSRGIYDNLKTCVDAVLHGKEQRFNARFLAQMNQLKLDSPKMMAAQTRIYYRASGQRFRLSCSTIPPMAHQCHRKPKPATHW